MNKLYFRFIRALAGYYQPEPARFAKGIASGYFRRQFEQITRDNGWCSVSISDACSVAYLLAKDPAFTC